MAFLTSGTFFSAISTSNPEISSRKLSLISSYQVEIKIPLFGYMMKLSDILSMIMVFDKSLPSKDKSFTRNGPFYEVC